MINQNKSQINPFSLARRINRPLILDGAMGSMLQQSGIKSSGALWMSKANLDNPEIVYNIHRQYIDAGADIITTNTFRTNPAAISEYGKRINFKKFVRESVKIAINAAEGLPVFVAGSNAPAEDCYQRKRKLTIKEIKNNHYKHIEELYYNGVHFILNETQSHFDEIKIISAFCAKNEIPFVISLFLDEKLKLLSGEMASEVIKYILDFSPLAVSVNCVMPKTFLNFYQKEKLNFNWGTYLNCGSENFSDEEISCGVSSSEYAKIISKILSKEPSFLGSCCGSTPQHTKAIKKLLYEKIRN
jgi:homocysteine S-methyltransferase